MESSRFFDSRVAKVTLPPGFDTESRGNPPKADHIGNMKTNKVLIIGFDALDHELFSRRRTQGFRLLPLFAPIPVTGPSWTSIYTGDGMARHNVRDVYGFEFRRRYYHSDLLHLLRWHVHNLGLLARLKPPLKRYATCETTPSRYVWDTLGEAGISLKIVNMPITCPARRVNGVMVSGFPIIDRKPLCYPEEIKPRIPKDYKELADVVHWFSDPERDPHAHWGRCLRQMGPEQAGRKIVQNAQRLAQLFLELPRADVEMVQFSFIDRMGHGFGMSSEIEEFCYSLAEDLIAKLTAAAPADLVMVISDHGFQARGHGDYGCLGLRGRLAEMVKLPEGYTPSVLDVAPTLAGLLGTRHQCEGNDLTVQSDYVTRDLKEEQEEKVRTMKHLTDLGYM